MSMTLAEILDLTGILDVTPGEDTPRALPPSPGQSNVRIKFATNCHEAASHTPDYERLSRDFHAK